MWEPSNHFSIWSIVPLLELGRFLSCSNFSFNSSMFIIHLPLSVKARNCSRLCCVIGWSGLLLPENSDEFAPVPMSLIFINLNKLAAGRSCLFRQTYRLLVLIPRGIAASICSKILYHG